MQLREKYSANGLENMTEQERLELLLTYSCGEDEAEKLASDLLGEYGSITALSRADSHLLMKDSRVNEQTAVLLRLIASVSLTLSAERSGIRTLNSPEAAKEFFRSRFIGQTCEQIIMVPLTKRFRPAKLIKISDGQTASASASYSSIADAALKSECSLFIIAHNHPNGDAAPSDSDIVFTKGVISVLGKLGAVLTDHIIIGAEGAFSMRESGLINGFSLCTLNSYTNI